MPTVLELQQAGYSDEEINLWVEKKSNTFTEAGYTLLEQSQYFGTNFESENPLIDNSLIGAANPDTFSKAGTENMTTQQKKDNEIEYYNNVDLLTKNKKNAKLQENSKDMEFKMQMQDIDRAMPYNFKNWLESQAYLNKTANNLDVNKKIYDDQGKPLDEDYHKNFTLNEDLITQYSYHTINAIDKIYSENGVLPHQAKGTAAMLNQVLKYYAKLLTGNESYGGRSYSWPDDTYGMFRMTGNQVQTAVNSYMDILRDLDMPTPYWMEELVEDKDISGLKSDAQVALFLSYLRTRPDFKKNFKGLMNADQQAITDMLFKDYLLPRGLDPKEFDILYNRFSDNINQHWTDLDIKNTSLQLPMFGKAMPDFISNWGDSLMGEGRNDVWERGGHQSVTQMMFRLYGDLKEMNEAGGSPLDARKLIDEFMTEGQRWDKRAVAGIRSVVQDLPQYIAGGTVANLLTLGRGGHIVTMGGAFGLHEMFRYALIESYMQNETDTFEGFWNIVLSKTAMKMYGKGFFTGATVGAGGLLSKQATKQLLMLTPLKNTALGQTIIGKGMQWGQAGGEIALLASVPAWMEGHAPKKEDFLDAAIIIFGLKSGFFATRKSVDIASPYIKNGMNTLYRIYAQTGKTPEQVLKDISRDESVLDDMLDNPDVLPSSYAEAAKEGTKAANEAMGEGDKNTQVNVPDPKFMVGNRVNIDGKGTDFGTITEVSFKDGEYIYLIETPNHIGRIASELKIEKLQEESFKIWSKEDQEKGVIPKPEELTRLREITKEIETIRKEMSELSTEKIRLPESSVQKWIKKKETVVWEDPSQFKKKQDAGEYDKKIEILETDEQVFETTRHRTSQVFTTTARKEILTSKDGKAQTNAILLWVGEFYPKLVKEAEKFIKEGKILKGKYENLSADALIKKLLSKKPNEKKIRLLFKLDKGNNLGQKDPIIVGEIDGNIFTFNLHAYMALKKLANGENAVVTADIQTKGVLKGQGVIIFRTKEGKITGLLMSMVADKSVISEAKKFKNEFGTNKKAFADTIFEQKFDETGKEKEPPKWDDIDLSKDTEVFKGLELYDLVNLFKLMSGGKTPIATGMLRRAKGFMTAGKFLPVKEGVILLNKILFSRDVRDYKVKLEQIVQTMAHELGHFIDYIPDLTMAKGNLLGRIASLRMYMKKWIAGTPDGEGPLTAAEVAKLKRNAEKTAKAQIKETENDLKKLGYKPEDILKIFTDTKVREILDPIIYDAYASASKELKLRIIRNAMKGIIDPHLDVILNKRKTDSAELKAAIDAEFKKAFEREVIKRGLVGLDQITIQLKKITQWWKPFSLQSLITDSGLTVAEAKAFIKYRYSPEELMADFMMSFLLKPRETSKIAPLAFNMWMNYMNRKAPLRQIWEEIQLELNLPKDQRIAKVIKDEVTTSMRKRESLLDKADKKTKLNEPYDVVRRALDSSFFTIINYYKKIMSEKVGFFSKKSNKPFELEIKDNILNATERYIYGDTLIEFVQNKLWKMVMKPLLDSNINRDVFGIYLKNRLVMNPEGTRANVLNPKGIDRTMAEDIVYALEAKFPNIRELAEKFYKFRQEVIIPEIEKLGIFDRGAMEQISNLKDYVAFVVEEYAKWTGDTWAKGFIMATQAGTAKDIVNVFEATVLKDWAILTIGLRHSMIQRHADFLKTRKVEIESLGRSKLNWRGAFMKDSKIKLTRPIEEKTIEEAKWNRKTKRWMPKDSKLDLDAYRLVEWQHDGKRKGAYFGREIADAYSNAEASKLSISMMQLAYGMNTPFRKIFTELNPPFWGYNVFRDIMRTVINLPATTYLDLHHGMKNAFVKQWIKAIKPAYRRLFRPEEMDADVEFMLQNQLMISVATKFRSRAEAFGEGTPAWATTDGFVRTLLLTLRLPKEQRSKLTESQLEKLAERAEKPIENLTKEEIKLEPSLRDAVFLRFEERFAQHPWMRLDNVVQPWYKLITSMEKMSRVFESTTKIASFKHLKKLQKEGVIDWSDAQIEYAVRNWAGSPNFLRKGSMAWAYNNILLFGNAAKEEYRSMIEAKRYQNEGIWWLKMFSYAVAPKILYRAGQIGMLGTAAHLYFNLIGSDTLAGYHVIPIGVILDTGEFKFGMKAEEGKGVLKAVYLQLPQDEFAKMIGMTAWHGMIEQWGQVKDDVHTNTWGKMLSTMAYTFDEQTPSMSPWFSLVMNAYRSLGLTFSKDKPKNYYSGRDLYPDYVHQARGMLGFKLRAKAFSKWLFNNSGGLMFYKFENYYNPYDFEPIIHEIEKGLNVPMFGKFVGRFIKVSDRGINEQVWNSIIEGNRDKADWSALADVAIQKYVDGKELTPEEGESLYMDKNWLYRYKNAMIAHFSSDWWTMMDGLDGTEFIDAIQRTMNIYYDYGYEPKILKEQQEGVKIGE